MGQTGRSRGPRLCVHQAWTRLCAQCAGTADTQHAYVLYIFYNILDRYREYVGVLCVLGCRGRVEQYVIVCSCTRRLGGRVFGFRYRAFRWAAPFELVSFELYKICHILYNLFDVYGGSYDDDKIFRSRHGGRVFGFGYRSFRWAALVVGVL